MHIIKPIDTINSQSKITKAVLTKSNFTSGVKPQNLQSKLEFCFETNEDESYNRRESMMSSFEDQDMSEGLKNFIPLGDFSIIKKPSQTMQKPTVFEMSEKKVSDDEQVHSRDEFPHDLLSTSIDNPKPENKHGVVILSRIDHANSSLHNESKGSEDMELELLRNFNASDSGKKQELSASKSKGFMS